MTDQYKHWAWVNTEPGLPDDEWKRRLARMKKAGISAILPEIFDISIEGGAQGVSLFLAGAMNQAHWERFGQAVREL